MATKVKAEATQGDIVSPNNMVIGQKIQKELFKLLGKKPAHFIRLEIKTIVSEYSYRVNVVCKANTDSVMQSVIRPLSYYVIVKGETINFNPPVKPII